MNALAQLIVDRLSGRFGGSLEKYAFSEADHPRDEIGRFVEKAASFHAAAKKSAKTVEERRKSYESLVAKREADGDDADVSDEEQQAEEQLDIAESEEEDNRLDAEIAEADAASTADESIDALDQEEPELAKELAVAERNHKRLSGVAAKLREKANRLKDAAEAGDGPVTAEVRAAISNHKRLASIASKKREKANALKEVVSALEQKKKDAEAKVESYSGQIAEFDNRQREAIKRYVEISRDPNATDDDMTAAESEVDRLEKEEAELERMMRPLHAAVERLEEKLDRTVNAHQEAEDYAVEADENATEAFAEIAEAKRTAAMELFDEADVDADSAEDEAEQARQELESLREEHSKTIEQREELKAMRARLPSMIAERIAALLSNVVEKYAAEKDDSRWITIGGADDGTRKHAGGTPVKIDKEGKIVAGPDSLAGKKVDELGSGKRAEEKPVDRGPDPQGSELGKKKDMPGLHDVKIESPGALTNAAYQRAGGGRSMQAKWSLRGPDGFVNLYEITKSDLRGDSPISVDAKLPPGRYVLSTGAGRDRIEHVINVGDQAERDSRAVSAVKKDYEDLEGSSAQVKWAKEIRDKWAVKFSSDPEEIEALAYLGSAKKIIDGRDDYPSNLIDAKRVDITNQNGEVIGSRYISHAAWDRYKNGTSPAWKDGKARAGDALLDVVTELHSINPDEIVSMAERE